MRLRRDERGRVPFALLGVVLLVGSATVAGVVGQRAAVDVDSRAAEVHHGTSAAARSALVTAAERATHAAARAPVVEPANTTYGRVLNESAPFRDALRIRVYRQAKAALENVSTTRGSIVGSVSVPGIDAAADLREAKRRVEIEALNGTRIAVSLRNVTLTVRRGDRTVERETMSPTVTLRSPVLSLYDRVSTFETRLHGSGTDRGLGRRLTANLYAMAWARGYAQYGGAPVANVVGTCHVGLATNAGVLDVQRAVFGRADPDGRAALTRAGLEVATTDLLAGVDEADWTDAVFDPGRAAEGATSDPIPGEAANLAAGGTSTTGVNATADRAFGDLLTGRRGPSLDEVLDDVYEAEVRLAARTTEVERETDRTGTRPDGWSVADTERTETATARRIEGQGTPVSAAGHALETYAWRIAWTERVTRTWRDGNRTRETTTTTRTVDRVDVSVVGSHARTAHAPDREIVDPHEGGGPLDGRNFADVRERALERLVSERGGPEALRRRAVNGSLNTTAVTLSVPQPDGLREHVYRDLVDRREATRNVSVETERGALAGTNVAGSLRDRFGDRRGSFHGVPDPYRSVAEKARVAARGAYLEAVDRRLTSREANASDANSALEGALSGAGVVDRDVGALLRRARESTPPSETGITVAGAPPYLITSEVRPASTPGVARTTHPLVTENHNLFAVSHGATADRIADAVVDENEGVPLRTGGAVLRGAHRTLTGGGNGSDERRSLRDAVAAATDEVRTAVTDALAEGPANVSNATAAAAADAGLARWETVHGRALAAANGSLVDAVSDAVAARTASDPVARDRREVRLRLALRAAAREATVPRGPVEAASNATRDAARDLVARSVEDGLRAATPDVGASLNAVPAGLPVTPIPGYWWATANAWTVEVRGQYQRFAAAAPAGSPAPAADLTVVRENRTVGLDVDGDGGPERLGRNRPISFEASTTVVVAVPPGQTGVGDVNGAAVERSSGWPTPGPG